MVAEGKLQRGVDTLAAGQQQLPNQLVGATERLQALVDSMQQDSAGNSSERQKLMFRVRARIDPALLERNITQVKTGLPGMAYVRIDPNVAWPDELALRTTR